MSEEQDGENEDYDREDIEHVENMLYANIHYNSGATDNPFSSPNPSTSNDDANNRNSNSNKDTDADRRNSGSRRNAKRYWSNNTPNTSKSQSFVPFFREKQSGIYKQAKANTAAVDNKSSAAAEASKKDENNTPEPVAPKQFTPYVSFLPFNDSTSNIAEEQIPVAGTSKGESSTKVLKTTNEVIRKNLTVTAKNINPFSKKHTIDSYKEMYEVPTLASQYKSNENSKKRLNPFNPLSKKAKRKKTEANQNQSKSVRKNRTELKREVTIEEVADTSIINVDDDEKDDDDDVIILPTQAPPLICVDDSDDEITPTNTQEHAFTEPNAVTDSSRKAARCASPSSSIQSTDDFIPQNDQRNFGFETFGTMSDDDLCQVSETVESNLRSKNDQPGTSKSVIPIDNDNAIFTPPKQMQKDKSKPSKKTYEVAANSFAAVDVYESESSDMPDTIYAKGATNKRKKVTDSDSSSVESIPVTKSKRLRKRKSSGSAKESDIRSDDSSSDLPDIDDSDDDDDEAPNGNSYLVRGEALGKVKNTNNKKKNTKKLYENANETNDKFINKLSDILRGQNESDENDDIENTQETSTESVAARDIVETVLQRRTKKSKKKQSVEVTEKPADNESEPTNPWEVTDQVGETDDLNLGQIFEEDAFNASPGSEQIQPEPENNSSVPQTATNSKQPNETNAVSDSDQPNEQGDIDAGANDNDDSLFRTEVSWNDEMRRFYNDSWGGETFSLRNIRARMPKGFLNWMISNRDKSILVDNRRQIRCLNCQDRGHRAKNCPRPPATKRCYMCGAEGHLEPRCPNKICLLCGRKAPKFLRGCAYCTRNRELACYVCKRKGHTQVLCPDRWRRYHSTISPNQPLVQEPTNLPPKQKYCCVCAQKGHLAESCYRAIRTPSISGVLSNTHVSSYRPLLNTENQPKNTAPQCTIFASDINDFSFNFGNDVSQKGNTIYARFLRAVNLNTDLNQSRASENDVQFVSESNLHDTSEGPIEVYDDFDFEMDNFDNISSSEQFSENTPDNSFMVVDSFEAESFATNESREVQTDQDSLNNTANSAEAELQELDSKMKTLSDLKEKLLSHKADAGEQSANQSETNIDINTSANTDAHNLSEQKDDVSTSTPLPDFIPLTSDEPERFEPTRSPSPVSADSTTATNEKTDATIHLTAKHCKYLLSENGNQFLRTREEKFNVSVRLEWRNFGNVLVVNGIAGNQKDFHNELKEFFRANEPDRPNYSSIANNLPKNREALIKFVRGQFILLDSAVCNNKYVADVQTLFNRITKNLNNQSKASMRQVSKLRKHLNMVLFGRYGFADGRTHLNALQDNLRTVIACQAPNVSQQIRKKIGEHLDYIFSDMDHGNYEGVIERYNQLKNDKSLPPLSLDRKLLGLKINVYPNEQPYDSSENTPRGRNFSRNSQGPSFGRNATSTNANGQNNRMNTLPSSVDIQINVSKPNSYQSQGFTNNQPMQRNSGCVYQNDRVLEKW